MWWTVPISIGVGTGVGVGLKGGSWPEVLAWSALTTGLSTALASGRTWRLGWSGVRWVAPYAWAGTKALAGDAAIMTRAATTTRTAAAVSNVVLPVAVGYTVGAVAGTIIVSEAEEKGIVYEGATADVLDFYNPVSGEGHYWDQGDAPTPGYFNIPGNASFIAQHYWKKWTT
jgi:hypothetical protein